MRCFGGENGISYSEKSDYVKKEKRKYEKTMKKIMKKIKQNIDKINNIWYTDHAISFFAFGDGTEPLVL